MPADSGYTKSPAAKRRWRWFRAVRPDCVVAELKFTDVIGMDLLSQLYAEMDGKPVLVFVWTRLIHTMLRKGASMLGVQGYFEKVKESERRMVEAILAAFGRTR